MKTVSLLGCITSNLSEINRLFHCLIVFPLPGVGKCFGRVLVGYTRKYYKQLLILNLDLSLDCITLFLPGI